MLPRIRITWDSVVGEKLADTETESGSKKIRIPEEVVPGESTIFGKEIESFTTVLSNRTKDISEVGILGFSYLLRQ